MTGTSRIGILLLLLLAGWVVLYYLLFAPIAREDAAPDGGLTILETDSIGRSPDDSAGSIGNGTDPPTVLSEDKTNGAPAEGSSAPQGAGADQAGVDEGGDPIPPPPPTTPYVVERGDTMESIAVEWFGSKAKWVLIAYENPLVDPLKLKAGVTLRLPPRGARVEGIPTEELRRLTRSTKYVVADGDSLWKIAARVYGNGSLHTLITEANRDLLKNGTELQIGWELVIPPYQKPAD